MASTHQPWKKRKKKEHRMTPDPHYNAVIVKSSPSTVVFICVIHQVIILGRYS
jgi:hypothetical protein